MAHEGIVMDRKRKELYKLLDELKGEYPGFTHSPASDSPGSSRYRNTYLDYNLVPIGEIWLPRENDDWYGLFYSNKLTNEEKQEAINVVSRKYIKSPSGKDVWNYHFKDANKYSSKRAFFYSKAVYSPLGIEEGINNMIMVVNKHN